MAREWHSRGCVYIIKAPNNLYKIGYTENVAKRLRDLRAMSPVELILVHVIEWDDKYSLENTLHQKYHSQLHHGEWYSLSDQEVKWLKTLDEDEIKRRVKAVEKNDKENHAKRKHSYFTVVNNHRKG